ncbi:unnamed protein product [Peronospora belbahrii]|uniref:Maleylacetoacetate isomerase n=1 Tax=Peronospora belbahrii TaxID=622444 RepID=A0ABN8D4T2_9STRA|nr:unnamed protein product [Peronospora belbahrii]
MGTYVLYSYWRSSCSWRFQDKYTALNPNQRLPTLVVDGHILPQSGAILEFLEETHPEKPLLPTDAFARAQVRNLCAIIGCDIQPIQNLSVVLKATENLPEEQRATKKQQWGRYWIERGFQALEVELVKTAGVYCFGDKVTLADLYLQPQVYNANRFGADVTKFPTIARISAALEAVPAFQKAHPLQQPDAIN